MQRMEPATELMTVVVLGSWVAAEAGSRKGAPIGIQNRKVAHEAVIAAGVHRQIGNEVVDYQD